MRITSVGYKTRLIDVTSENAGDIYMEPDANMLDEVVVKGHRPVHKLGKEGLITTVDGSILSQLGTAEDVLRNVPGVLNKEGAIEVFGKGKPLIYINGRLMRDASELNELKSQDIVSVEVITNPGAKYNASVQSVIRIKTRKPLGEGWGGHLRSSFFQGEMSRTYSAFLWNYRHRGLDVFGTVSDYENGYLTNGLDDKDNYYMKHVYVACVRALDYLCSLPEWDGRNVFVQGGSQGGALSLITAGLDPRVTACVANHPALADMAGYLDNRAGGYPHFNRLKGMLTPQKVEAMAYYDVVNFARRITCPVFLTWGYNDNVCPPTTSYIVWNVITAPKESLVTPVNEHWTSSDTNYGQMEWLKKHTK